MAPDSDRNECSPLFEQQRLPMRKPMSMVEYWVITGEQPYSQCLELNKRSSDAGSSLVEEENFQAKEDKEEEKEKEEEEEEEEEEQGEHKQDEEEHEMITLEKISSSPKLPVDSSLEKKIDNSLVHNKNDRILINTSNSSLDTAVYILANNNITPKTETAAIIEGSKSFSENQIVNTSSKLKFDHNGINGVQTVVSILNNPANGSHKSINGCQKRKKYEKNVNSPTPTLSSKSDESLYRSKYIDNSKNSTPEKFQEQKQDSIFSSKGQFKGQLSKATKRKKLYNSQDSNVEFTPVSDENMSFKLLKSSSNKGKHPALETPKSSKFLQKKNRKSLRKNFIKPIALISQSKVRVESENSHDTFLKNSKNFTKSYSSSNEKSLESSLELFDNSRDSSNSSYNLKSLSIDLQKSPKNHEIQSKVSNGFLEKKNEPNDGTKNTFRSSQSKNFLKVNTKADKYTIVFSDEDEDEIYIVDDEIEVGNDVNDKTIKPSDHSDEDLDKSSKKKEVFIHRKLKTDNSKKNTLSEFDKSKISKKIRHSDSSKKKRKNMSKERKRNEKIKLFKSDAKASSSSSESENIVLFKKPSGEKNKNWRDESIQMMKKVYKHTIVFSSSDESE